MGEMLDAGARQSSLDEVLAGAASDTAARVDPLWKGHARGRLLQLAKQLPELTTDDLWETGLPDTRENRALGPIMLWGQTIGIISATDRVQISRLSKRNHGRRISVWRSNLYGKD